MRDTFVLKEGKKKILVFYLMSDIKRKSADHDFHSIMPVYFLLKI